MAVMQQLNCFIVISVLCSAVFETAQSVSVRAAKKQGETGGYDTPPVCSVSASKEFPAELTVFIKADNTRSYSYGQSFDPRVTVRCKGELPANCTAPPLYKVPLEPTGVFLQVDRASSRGPLSAPTSAGTAVASSSGLKSCDALACPCEQENHLPLKVPAEQQMMDMMKPVCNAASDDTQRTFADDPFRVLIVGLGSATLPMYALENCRVFVSKGIKIEATEQDPRIINLASKLFGYHSVPELNTLEQVEGGLAVKQRSMNQTKYDVVLVNTLDASGGVPESCRNPTFITNVKNILRTNGRVIQTLRSPQYEETTNEYVKTFGRQQVKSYKTKEPNEWIVEAGAAKAFVQSGVGRASSLTFLAFLTVVAALVQVAEES